MEKKLHSFLKSGLLDKYILDETSSSESLQVEHYIDTYPEVEREYLRLQNNLEILSRVKAVNAPQKVFHKIIKDVDAIPGRGNAQGIPSRRTPWFSIAASIAALIIAGSSFLMYQRNQDLLRENQVLVDEIFDLRGDINDNNQRLDDVMRQFMKLKNTETEKYVMRGNERAKDLKTVAYINAVDKTSMIDVISLPQLPENHSYQIWAEMQDRMVNLGILDPSERELQSIPYVEDALGLSITIQPNGKNQRESEAAVAEIELKNRNN